jgi:hypothetical protein
MGPPKESLGMRIRVLDFDGSIPAQDRVLRMFNPEIFDLRSWGPRLRLACRWKRFYRLERKLDRLFGSREPFESWISLLGSGDFHHVALAFLRRVRRPFNLLVLDRQPDWLRGAPMIHCGSWLNHAAQLPNVQRIFHVGGESGFEGPLHWLAPKKLITSGKIVPLPATRVLRQGFWKNVPHQPLRRSPQTLIDRDRLEELLWPHLDELDRFPLYVSLDKNLLWLPESMTNWDAGVLDLTEVQEVLQFFLKAAGNDLLGMDIVGDWSNVFTQGLLRRAAHRCAHPSQNVDGEQARMCNERTNLSLLQFLTHDPVAESVTYRSRQRSV